MVLYLKDFNMLTSVSKFPVRNVSINITYSSKKAVFLVYIDLVLINFFVLTFVFNKFISRRSFIYIYRVLPFLDSLGLLDS